MKKSTFVIWKMDCPSEEHMIRMKLEPSEQVKYLNFDISKRKLKLYHIGQINQIHHSISQLSLDDILKGNEEAELPEAISYINQRKELYVR